MVAHLLWEQRVAGSNPVTPTALVLVDRSSRCRFDSCHVPRKGRVAYRKSGETRGVRFPGVRERNTRKFSDWG